MDTAVLAIIGSVLGIAMMVIAILNFYTNKNNRANDVAIQQATFNEKLLSIEKELVEIKALLVTNNERYLALERCSNDNFNRLDKRISTLEIKRSKGGIA